MAPPTRLRPHLNDLLQKNLELEHVVADLRHQLTQSFAKWADERKTLATGCDALMASFAKFRARLDVPSDWVDSEGEVEGGGHNEETGEADNPNGMLEIAEGDQATSVAEDLRKKCHALAAELQVKEEELEESRRRREATEEELRRVQRSLETQSEQLQAALASVNTDANDTLSPEHTCDGDTSTQTNPAATSELEDTLEKLTFANREINRLKQLLQQWQKYGNDWKRDAQSARLRASELEIRETDLIARLKVTEDDKTLLERERKEIQRLSSALEDQTAAVEHQRTACQESLKRVHDLESVVSLLRTQLSPEQLAAFDSEQKQVAPEPLNSIESATPRTDPNTKRSDSIVLKIPYRSVKRPPGVDNVPQYDQQNQTPGCSSPAPQNYNNIPSYNATEFELCIHTCNSSPCRNESRSFLWPRRQASLPRHALSVKKHRLCAPNCPGHRLLMMPVADALKEPRRAKCRPPTETELATAAEEARGTNSSARTSEKGSDVEGGEGSEEREEAEEAEDGSSPETGAIRKAGEEEPPSKNDTLNLGKRLRSRLTDGEEPQRARKLRSRISTIAKP